MAAAENLTKEALKAADGDGARALRAAVRITRWKMIAACEIEPGVDEWLPGFIAAAAREGGDK